MSDAPLRAVLDELGGWPVLDSTWCPSHSLEKVIGIIKRNFTVGVLVEEWIGPDDRDSKRHIIQVFSSFLFLQTNAQTLLPRKTVRFPKLIEIAIFDISRPNTVILIMIC